MALDICTGLGGWARGLIDAGWHVIGIDIEDMFAALGEPKPEHYELVLTDMRDVRGADYAHVELIVGSSPCPDFSYRAMPWTRARALTGPFLGIKLFWEQFRIQRECNEARAKLGLPPIPMVVENVRGAIPWVGRSKWNFGSYHLWGDVPALMPSPAGLRPSDVLGIIEDGRKVPGFRFDGSGRSFQTASVGREGLKAPGGSHIRDGAKSTARLATPEHRPPARVSANPPAEGRKGAGAGAGAEWFDQNLCVKSSKSPARKAASARIAKIPYALAYHIGRVYLPEREAA